MIEEYLNLAMTTAENLGLSVTIVIQSEENITVDRTFDLSHEKTKDMLLLAWAAYDKYPEEQSLKH